MPLAALCTVSYLSLSLSLSLSVLDFQGQIFSDIPHSFFLNKTFCKQSNNESVETRNIVIDFVIKEMTNLCKYYVPRAPLIRILNVTSESKSMKRRRSIFHLGDWHFISK